MTIRPGLAAVAIEAIGWRLDTGPLLAGALFDPRGSYDLYLMLVPPTVIGAAVLISQVPPAAAPIIDPGSET